jgi:methionine synthase II (cobalamin-independent)
MGYTVEMIEKLSAEMKAMPEVDKSKQEKTKPEAVKMLSSEIKELQRRGYTLEQIAETMTKGGIDITTGTLKAYIQRAKGKRAAKPKVQAEKTNTETKKDVKEAGSTKKSGTFTVTPDTENL